MPRLEIKWTENALFGVQCAYRFLAEKDKSAERLAVGAIRKHVEVLHRYPNAGRPAQDLEPEHRELLIPFGASGYVLVYEVYADTVLILAVRHQKEAGY